MFMNRDDHQRHLAEEGERHDQRIRAREQGDGFFAFATDLTRSHARELILSQPAPLFGAPPLPDPVRNAAIDAETFTEGRMHRKAPAPVNYHAEG